MNNQLYRNGRKIIELLYEHGYRAYFVGGFVRDYLLNRPLDDVDIVTSATPVEIMNIFPKVIPVGIDHGTVIVRFKGHSYELTTFRYPEKVNTHKQSNDNQLEAFLYNDLKHRDFTINAIAMDINQNIIDPFFGQADLNKKMIRSVHDTSARLTEDPLRILRAFRFVSELGFILAPSLIRNIQKVNSQIKTVASERLNQEFTKLIQGQYVQQSIKGLINAETYKYLPIIKESPIEFATLQQKIKPLNSLSEFIALMNYLNDQSTIKSFVHAWKCSRKTAAEALHLLNILNDYRHSGINAWLVYQLGETNIDKLVRLVNILFPEHQLTKLEVRNIHLNLPIISRQQMEFSGSDLREMFPYKRPGKWIQDSLIKVEQQIVNQTLNNEYQVIKEWLKCHPPEDV